MSRSFSSFSLRVRLRLCSASLRAFCKREASTTFEVSQRAGNRLVGELTSRCVGGCLDKSDRLQPRHELVAKSLVLRDKRVRKIRREVVD